MRGDPGGARPWSVSLTPACCSSPDVAHVPRGHLASAGEVWAPAPAAQPSALQTWVSGAPCRRSVTRQRASLLICGSGVLTGWRFEKLSGNFSVLLIQSRV